MWSRLILAEFCFIILCPPTYASSEAKLNVDFATITLTFTENKGQWPDSILYQAAVGGATLWFAPSGVYYQLSGKTQNNIAGNTPFLIHQMGARPIDLTGTTAFLMVSAQFIGANLNNRVEAISQVDYKCNYFIGNDRSKWQTNVSNYTSIKYLNIYNGIDLKYFGNGQNVEYDFIISPGADYRQIKIRYNGVESLTLGKNGELVVKTANGEIIEKPPLVFQSIEGKRIEVMAHYRIDENNTFSFTIDEAFDVSHDLVIDPGLEFSTYLGGNNLDFCGDIAVDEDGSAYVVGETFSTNFPTQDPVLGSAQGVRDMFVTKLSSSGSSLVYSTYLGGDSSDYGYSIALDTFEQAYITGLTFSPDFPTENPVQAAKDDGADVIIAKLSSGGDSLVFSTYLGGSHHDLGYGIAVDEDGDAYLTGETRSVDFPTQNAYEASQQSGGDNWDAFITKIESSGDDLVFSTYLGGFSIDGGRAIAVDASEDIYVTGHTESTDFPMVNPYQSSHPIGKSVAFVTKMLSPGDSLEFSTYLGGTSGNNVFDGGYGIAVDSTGSAYVTGHTTATDFPLQSQYQSNQTGVDGFVTRFSTDGDSLIYSTYLGGGSTDYGHSIAIDNDGSAYVVGVTNSSDFPSVEYFQTYQGNTDAFITKLSANGSSAVYSTCFGRASEDGAWNVAVDGDEAAYVTGWTYSSGFAIYHQYQTDQTNSDAYISKFIEICCSGNRGDVNGDGTNANISDLTYLSAYLNSGGPPPPCPEEADCDSDGVPATQDDLDFLIARIFGGGPAPGSC